MQLPARAAVARPVSSLPLALLFVGVLSLPLSAAVELETQQEQLNDGMHWTIAGLQKQYDSLKGQLNTLYEEAPSYSEIKAKLSDQLPSITKEQLDDARQYGTDLTKSKIAELQKQYDSLKGQLNTLYEEAPSFKEIQAQFAHQSHDITEADVIRGSEDGRELASVSDDELVVRQIDDIISIRGAGVEFYKASAKSVGQAGSTGCVMGTLAGALLGLSGGPLAAAVLAAKGCAGVGVITTLAQAMNAPFKHWSESMNAAYRARRAYKLSFMWLNIDGFDLAGADPKQVISKAFRACALRYHPDKLSMDLKEHQRLKAAGKLANCRFAKVFIMRFQQKYGVLDPDDVGEDMQRYLRKFAGAWASTFGSSEGLSETQVEEWMTRVRHHSEL